MAGVVNQELVFEKTLSEIQIQGGQMCVSVAHHNNLLPLGQHERVFEAICESQHHHQFRVAFHRNGGYRKLVFTRGWTHIVREMQLQPGDIVRLYRETHHPGGQFLIFRIVFLRPITLFGSEFEAVVPLVLP